MATSEGGSAASRKNEFEDLRLEIAAVQNELLMMRPALAGLAGLDNVAAGIADLVGVLAPIRDLAISPEPAPPNVERAISSLKFALALDLSMSTFDRVPVPDHSIAYIGQVV